MKNKGFTLIELLVVVAIIGVLATIVLSSFSDTRARARDARRKSDLHQIRNALYMTDNPTLQGSGVGYLGNGGGSLKTIYAGTTESVLDSLVSKGYLSSEILDPLYNQSAGELPTESYNYMAWYCGNTLYLLANLEGLPSPAPDVICGNYDTRYGMDYFVEVN